MSSLSASPMFLLTKTPKPLKKLKFSMVSTFQPIECSSRPQKKATAHHRKTRPRKSAQWDIRRGPAVYPPMPALPQDWSFAASDENADAGDGAAAVVEASAPLLE